MRFDLIGNDNSTLTIVRPALLGALANILTFGEQGSLPIGKPDAEIRMAVEIVFFKPLDARANECIDVLAHLHLGNRAFKCNFQPKSRINRVE